MQMIVHLRHEHTIQDADKQKHKVHSHNRRLCSGDDLDKVGGAEADHSFMTLSDTSSCGKLTALAKLLDLWYSQDNANKVP